MNTPAIWIVDDDEGILEVVQIILSTENYKVKGFGTAKHFLKTLETEKPSLVLLDILLAGEDGRTICRTVKNNPATQDIPILMMSADTNIEEKSKEAGAEGYIKKPFDIDHLVRVVNKFRHNYS